MLEKSGDYFLRGRDATGRLRMAELSTLTMVARAPSSIDRRA
jgi:hypothetical protein